MDRIHQRALSLIDRGGSAAFVGRRICNVVEDSEDTKSLEQAMAVMTELHGWTPPKKATREQLLTSMLDKFEPYIAKQVPPRQIAMR